MKQRTPILPGSLFLMTAFSVAARSEAPGSIEWLGDLEKARALARAQGKPLLVVFR